MEVLYQPEKIGSWGFIKGGDTEYFSFPAVNASRLKLWLKSEKHFEANPSKKATNAMAMGTAFHTMLLTPDIYEEKYREFIKPFPDSTMAKKENKEAWRSFEAQGYVLTTKEETESLREMAKSVESNPIGKFIIEGGNIYEQGIWFVHESGIICKIKPDCLSIRPSGNILPIDLKKAKDASERGFRKDCVNYDYPIQNALYDIGIKAAYSDATILPFHFLMCEPAEPYLCQHYTISPWQIRLCQNWVNETLYQIADKIKNNKEFNGYSDKLIEVELPEYYTNKFINYE